MPTVDEIYQLVKKLEEKLDNLTIHSSQVQAGDLSSIVDNLGLQRAGEIRYGAGSPGRDFVGLRLYGSGIAMDDSDYDNVIRAFVDSASYNGIAYDGGDLLIGSNDTNTVEESLLYDASAKTLTFMKGGEEEHAAAPGGWTEIGSFADSWANYDTTVYEAAGYYKDPFGLVHLKGVLKNGTPTAADTTSEIFILPAGYRPNLKMDFGVISNGAHARLEIQTTGAVKAISGTSDYFSLDGVSFPVST